MRKNASSVSSMQNKLRHLEYSSHGIDCPPLTIVETVAILRQI